MFMMGGSVAVAVVALLVAVVVVLEGGGGEAFTLCNVTEEGFEACKPALVQQPNPAAPSPECCDAVSVADIKCLCSYRNSTGGLALLGIDPELALALPEKCNLGPPVQC